MRGEREGERLQGKSQHVRDTESGRDKERATATMRGRNGK